MGLTHRTDLTTVSGLRVGRTWNGRRRAAAVFGVAAVGLITVALVGTWMPESWYAVDFSRRSQPPSPAHLFGTDWLGRDMLSRSIKGLSISIRIGLFAAVVSSVIAIVLGTLAATLGGWADRAVLWLVDLFQGMPHLIFMILVAILMGRGATGIMLGVALTHWVSLARVVRAETLHLAEAPYVRISRGLGRSPWWVATRHYLPHIVPPTVTATVLMFPHAILHEAALTFLGFGMPHEVPSIGVILSEAMRYLTTGAWWLTVFPGAALLAVVLLFDRCGRALAGLISPATAHT
ncbi:MAG: ABC transporter permease [Propioniciclava sp.]